MANACADARAMDAGFREAMRAYAGGVTIVASGRRPYRCGLTATAVCSVSDDPPSLLACVNRKTAAHAVIRKEGCFSVNLLRCDQKEIADGFAGRSGLSGEERFSLGVWDLMRTGAPVLRDALAVFDCSLSVEHSFGTHSIFVGLVQEVRTLRVPEPLIYLHGRFVTPVADGRRAPASALQEV